LVNDGLVYAMAVSFETIGDCFVLRNSGQAIFVMNARVTHCSSINQWFAWIGGDWTCKRERSIDSFSICLGFRPRWSGYCQYENPVCRELNISSGVKADKLVKKLLPLETSPGVNLMVEVGRGELYFGTVLALDR
jgi:hypothetical protein